MRILLNVLAFLLFFPVFGKTQPQLPASTQDLIELYVGKRKNKALIIGIIQKGEVAYFPFGQKSANDKEAPDAKTMFEIGAISAVFTTSFMYYESMQGRFDLGDPIQFYVPQEIEIPGYVPIRCVEIPIPNMPPDMGADQPPRIISCSPDPQEADICIAFCDLASHTAGLANSIENAYNWNPFGRNTGIKDLKPIPLNSFWATAGSVTPSNAPGRFFSYSNYGIALLGNSLAHINQQDFDVLMEEQMIQGVFNLNQTAYNLDKKYGGLLIPGHNQRGKAVDYSNFQAFAPAAGLRSNADNLLRWLKLNMETKDQDWSNVFDQVQQARFDVPFRVNGMPTLGGFGWLITNLSEKSNLPITWMNGGTEGFRSFIGFNRDTQTGIVVLSNSANSVDEIAWDLLKGLLDK